MTKPIPTYWTEKFKQLLDKHGYVLKKPLTLNGKIIQEFLGFCNQEEIALGERWEKNANKDRHKRA